MWPSAMNLYNDAIDFDTIISTLSTASDSRKGFLFTGDPKEIFYLGAGHIAINVTLSGKGHTYMQYLEGFKKRGIKITLILVNDRPPVGVSGKFAPPDFKNPFFYMIDFESQNGQWQKYNFDRVVEDYAEYVDNWVIGNEINSQVYNYYGPATIEEYTYKYCENFKVMYETIKKVNKDANLFISFDQYWNLPRLNSRKREFDKENGKYRYNAKEQLEIINKYLDKDIEWGVAIHPYPTPIEEAMFWDDQYSGFDENTHVEEDRPYFLTSKNFEIIIDYLNERRFLLKNKKPRRIIISELGFTSHNGEEIQAAGIYYVWKKAMKYKDRIDAFLYNAQTDLSDEYNFGLTSDKNRKRLAWVVFRDMDKDLEYNWCQDLLDRVLEEHGYAEDNCNLYKISTASEITE